LRDKEKEMEFWYLSVPKFHFFMAFFANRLFLNPIYFNFFFLFSNFAKFVQATKQREYIYQINIFLWRM